MSFTSFSTIAQTIGTQGIDSRAISGATEVFSNHFDKVAQRNAMIRMERDARQSRQRKDQYIRAAALAEAGYDPVERFTREAESLYGDEQNRMAHVHAAMSAEFGDMDEFSPLIENGERILKSGNYQSYQKILRDTWTNATTTAKMAVSPSNREEWTIDPVTGRAVKNTILDANEARTKAEFLAVTSLDGKQESGFDHKAATELQKDQETRLNKRQGPDDMLAVSKQKTDNFTALANAVDFTQGGSVTQSAGGGSNPLAGKVGSGQGKFVRWNGMNFALEEGVGGPAKSDSGDGSAEAVAGALGKMQGTGAPAKGNVGAFEFDMTDAERTYAKAIGLGDGAVLLLKHMAGQPNTATQFANINSPADFRQQVLGTGNPAWIAFQRALGNDLEEISNKLPKGQTLTSQSMVKLLLELGGEDPGLGSRIQQALSSAMNNKEYQDYRDGDGKTKIGNIDAPIRDLSQQMLDLGAGSASWSRSTTQSSNYSGLAPSVRTQIEGLVPDVARDALDYMNSQEARRIALQELGPIAPGTSEEAVNDAIQQKSLELFMRLRAQDSLAKPKPKPKGKGPKK